MQKSKLLNLIHTKFQRKMYPSPEPRFLDAESELGSQLFGPIPAGVERKFFHSTKKNVWIWYENGTTIRYEVRPQGIYKRVNSGAFVKLAGSELTNFRNATKNYLSLVKSHLYRK